METTSDKTQCQTIGGHSINTNTKLKGDEEVFFLCRNVGLHFPLPVIAFGEASRESYLHQTFGRSV